MNRRAAVRRWLVRGLVAAVFLPGLVGVVPAVAQVTSPRMVVRPVPSSAFSLTVRVHGEPARHATVNCAPTGGSHPAPRRACGQLDAARGEIAAIPATGDLCTTEYRPATVTASGIWRGERRGYQREFGNLCEAVRETGGVVFAF
ncbi:MAG: SSI family serine proteinase inhibitor [Micromonosporaceae bacterium]